LFVFVLLGVAGCSLFTDLGGLSDDDDGGAPPSPDAGSPGLDGGGPSAMDGSTTTEASPDSGPTLVCPAGAHICDDFQRATPFVPTWTDQYLNGGGTLAIENGQLVARVPARASATGPEPLAFLQKTVPGPLSRFTIECDVGFDRRPSPTDFHLFLKVNINTGGTAGRDFQLVYVTIENDHNGFVLQDFTTTSMIEYKSYVLNPGFHHVKMEFAVGGKSRLTINGSVIHEIDTPAFMKPGRMEFNAGVSGSGSDSSPTTPVVVTTDNVIFTAE